MRLSSAESHSTILAMCGHVPVVMAAAALLSACAADPFIDNVRATPEEKSIQQSDQPGALTGSAAALMRVANTTRARGDYATAITIYRRVADLAPTKSAPYLAMGDALMAVGAFNDAVSAYHSAISRGAKVDAYRGLGNALISLDQPALALTQFDEAIRLADADVRGYSGKGVALDMMGQYAAAQEIYRGALEIAPDNKTVLNNLGLSLAFSGEHDKAIEILRPIALAPEGTPRQRQNLALAHGMSGDMAAAARIARMDLDEASVQKNLAYYQILRAREGQIGDAKAVGAHRGNFKFEGSRPPPALGQASPLADPALLSLIEAMNNATPGQNPAPPKIE
jgi:Flp pilus assembly protein TadD